MSKPRFSWNPDRLKDIARRLKGQYGAEQVLIFGSTARGNATEDSDIDLLIIAQTSEKFYERIASVLRSVRDLSYGMPLAPIVLTREEIRARLNRGDQFVQEILATGVEP